jgi:hypothetical protein
VTYFSSGPVMCSFTPSSSVRSWWSGIYFFLVVACDLVEPESDVGDFGSDGVTAANVQPVKAAIAPDY